MILKVCSRATARFRTTRASRWPIATYLARRGHRRGRTLAEVRQWNAMGDNVGLPPTIRRARGAAARPPRAPRAVRRMIGSVLQPAKGDCARAAGRGAQQLADRDGFTLPARTRRTRLPDGRAPTPPSAAHRPPRRRPTSPRARRPCSTRGGALTAVGGRPLGRLLAAREEVGPLHPPPTRQRRSPAAIAADALHRPSRQLRTTVRRRRPHPASKAPPSAHSITV